MEDIKENLENLGLSEKEVRVYLALLKSGEETASRISEIADLNRITTYTILKSLKEKGFCSVHDKNYVQYFHAIKPEQILFLLDEKKEKIKSILPLLREQEKQIQEKPEISLFEGGKGVTSVFDILLSDAENEKKVLAYGNLTIAEKLLEYESLHWRKTRFKKKIKIKAIVESIPDYIKKDKKWQELSERKILKDLSNLNSYTLITERYVAYFSFKGEIIAILIKNEEIVKKEKFNFNLLWNLAKK